MSELTFNQFRQSVKNDYYKRSIRNVIEPQILNIYSKYEDRLLDKYNSNSLKYELNQLLSYYIDSYYFDEYLVYEVYNEIARDYNKRKYTPSQCMNFVEDSTYKVINNQL